MGGLSAVRGRGALSALVLLAAGVAGAGCDQDKAALPPPPTPEQGRSNAVAAPAREGAKAATSVSAHAAPAAPRQLCVGQAPRPAPSSSGGGLATVSAAGSAPPPASIGFGVGKWVWMNFWAAWCKPCQEEMPRLLGWQQKLRAAGVLIDLAFVSLDDDQRQLQRFLEAQAGTGVRASYWLPDEAPRAAWLKALGVKETPELPVHAIAAPSGQVTCVIQGAVEDVDYPAIAAFMGAKR
jgi:thiol-disulfide isomerase/thioredoxin